MVTSSWGDVILFESIISNRGTYIKIEVEGMELKVIKAVESFLRNNCVKMIVLEIDDANMSRYSSTPQQVYELFSDMGLRRL